MALIVNVLNDGKLIELINTDGKLVLFSDTSDGFSYDIMDICGTSLSGKVLTAKRAREAAIEFLERRGHKELAGRLKQEYRTETRERHGYLPCPATRVAASA
jgi:hypothetical protein